MTGLEVEFHLFKLDKAHLATGDAGPSGGRVGARVVRLAAADTRRGEAIEADAAITTVAGGTLTADLVGGKVVITDAKGGKTTVTQADVMTSNGVIHVTDGVFLPG